MAGSEALLCASAFHLYVDMSSKFLLLSLDYLGTLGLFEQAIKCCASLFYCLPKLIHLALNLYVFLQTRGFPTYLMSLQSTQLIQFDISSTVNNVSNHN